MDFTQTCNTSMERVFCDVSEFVQVKKLRLQIKSTNLSKWDSAGFLVKIVWYESHAHSDKNTVLLPLDYMDETYVNMSLKQAKPYKYLHFTYTCDMNNLSRKVLEF